MHGPNMQWYLLLKIKQLKLNNYDYLWGGLYGGVGCSCPGMCRGHRTTLWTQFYVSTFMCILELELSRQSRKRFYPLNHLALPVDSSCGMALHKLWESQHRRQCPGAKDKDDQQWKTRGNHSGTGDGIREGCLARQAAAEKEGFSNCCSSRAECSGTSATSVGSMAIKTGTGKT